MDYGRLEKLFVNNLGLKHRPVAVAFMEADPPGIEKFEGMQPSGCSFWKLASQGRTFYTVEADHFNCPLGTYTHHFSLPEDRAHELGDTLKFMTDVGYLQLEEVPVIQTLANTPAAVVYAPLADTPVDPDVVLFWGPPGTVMLLQEAAIRGNVGAQFTTLPRPTCMILPAALKHGTVASSGCIGNRVYTELADADLYVAVPGRDVAAIAEQTAVIRAANAALLQYHRDRKQTLVQV